MREIRFALRAGLESPSTRVAIPMDYVTRWAGPDPLARNLNAILRASRARTPEGDGFQLPNAVMVVTRPTKRVRDLVKDCVSHVGLGSQ